MSATRPYRPGDERALVAAWNAALPADPIDEAAFARRILADANFLPDGLRVAEAPDGRGVAGFALALARRVPLDPSADLEPDTGWITAFGVDPAWRGRGLGTALLRAAMGHLRERGCRRVEVSPYAPGYFWPGPDRAAHDAALRLLEHEGFAPLAEVVAMERSLTAFTPVAEVGAARVRLEREGLCLRPLGPALVWPLLEFIQRAFYPDWTRAVRASVAHGVPWGRTRLALRGDAVVGFAQYGAYDGHPDRFGPFGVDAAERGRGIGAVLLEDTLRAMQGAGCRAAWFLWTGEASPAGRLYRRSGFSVSRRFVLLRRPL